MKKILTTILLGSMCIASAPLSVSANVGASATRGTTAPVAVVNPGTTTGAPVRVDSSLKRADGFTRKELSHFDTSSLKRQLPAKSTRSGDEEVYSITLTYSEVEDLQLVSLLYAGPESTYWDMAGDEEEIVVMGSGEYTLVAVFQPTEEGEPLRIVVNENVEVNQDITLNIDPLTATNRITFSPTLPNGDQVVGPLVNSHWDVIENGNISSDIGTYIKSVFASKRYGSAVEAETNLNRVVISEDKIIDGHNFGDFFINPGLSSDFECSQICCFSSADNSTIMLSQLHAEGTASQTVTYNSYPWAYSTYEEIFTKSNYPKDVEIESEGVTFSWYETSNGIPTVIIGLEGEDVNKAQRVAYNLGPDRGYTPTNDVMARVSISYYGPSYEDGWLIHIPTYTLKTSVMRQEGETMVTLATPMLLDPYQNAFLNNQGGVDVELAMWGNPSFSSVPGVDPQIAGDNAPFIQYIDLTTSYRVSCQWLELGRVSESPEIGFINIYSSFNGEEFKGTYNEDYEDYWAFFQNINDNIEGYKGKIINNIEYDKGMEIDGIVAKSHAYAVYDRGQTEDLNVPQLTMLQFRNSDGFVTDRFDTAADGLLTFSAADFEHLYDPWYDKDGNVIGINEWYKFTSTPSVKVEYSPLDANDWKEIEVVEDPAKFIATGYGSYFSGSLESVTEKAYGGWFDI